MGMVESIEKIISQKEANTEQRYSSYTLPMAARCFCLHMTKVNDSHFEGEIRNLFFEEIVAFNGLDEAFLYMDRMMDELGCPQAGTILRDFRRKQKKRQNHGKELAAEEQIQHEKELRFRQYWNKNFLEVSGTWKVSFKIEILYRQFSSWQGEITVLLPGRLKGKKQYFRSVLELMNLIWSAYQEIGGYE